MKPLVGVRLAGEPVPYRYELVKRGGQRVIADAKRYAAWKRDAVDRIKRWVANTGTATIKVPVVCVVEAWMERAKGGIPSFATVGGQAVPLPRSWQGPRRVPCVAPGDTTNLGKAAEDAIVQGGLLLDDRLCVETQARKGWTAESEPPCVEVRLYDASEWYLAF